MGNIRGKLYICATPIGNLEDITLRVLRILKEVDIIAAEDTRHTLKLLNHYKISKPLISYHEHNKRVMGPQIVEKLLQGKNIALVSDAGMPGISDPGEDIVKLCIDNSIEIEVLPGPSAIITALVSSGMSTRRFSFEGFLDRDKKNRRKRLELIKEDDRTIVFYESPHRLLGTLKDIFEILGNRKIVIARELTKKYEEVLRGTAKEIYHYFKENPARGEIVILVEGNTLEKRETSEWEKYSIKEHILYYMEKGISKKDAVKRVSKDRNIPKRQVYDHSLDI